MLFFWFICKWRSETMILSDQIFVVVNI